MVSRAAAAAVLSSVSSSMCASIASFRAVRRPPPPSLKCALDEAWSAVAHFSLSRRSLKAWRADAVALSASLGRSIFRWTSASTRCMVASASRSFRSLKYLCLSAASCSASWSFSSSRCARTWIATASACCAARASSFASSKILQTSFASRSASPYLALESCSFARLNMALASFAADLKPDLLTLTKSSCATLCSSEKASP
mmetsp:Transcript_28440/g.80353  ORF Transcript_28440/g.80353 Transcript_28440/m.80353 type:complete len:201 (+) Transcript_28440:2734-3336(+)